jgi:CDP-paratose 2-epimerase
MKILITGICGFVGSTLAKAWLEADSSLTVYGLDNLIRPGSELNRGTLRRAGIHLFHGDIRLPSDFDVLPKVDWVIDAAANPSVLAGVDGQTSSRQVVEHNLIGTVNILEFCKKNESGFVLLSTSRVYSLATLANLSVKTTGSSFSLNTDQSLPAGISSNGVSEVCSVAPPVSLYGSTKLASEILALEYGESFHIPVWINRCGVLSGAGQFGKPDQGIFSYWINAWMHRRPLTYIGFGGYGHQVRDCLHPRDLIPLLRKQTTTPNAPARVVNIGGGMGNAMSLVQLSAWCADRFGPHTVARGLEERRFDVPWLVMDSGAAQRVWGWQPKTSLAAILEEIAVHAERNPNWFDIST